MNDVRSAMELSPVIPDKRAASDRRTLSWRTVLFGFARSRRHAHRRYADNEVVFLDWHHPWLFFLSVGTMLLSVADAFLTLQLLQLGMIEANPLMRVVMGQSITLFVSTKLAMTAFGILVLVFLAKQQFMNRFRCGLFLTVFFSGYACLVCYELVSLFRLG